MSKQLSHSDDDEVAEELVSDVADLIAGMTDERRAEFAKRRGLTVAELDQIIDNWKASRQ